MRVHKLFLLALNVFCVLLIIASVQITGLGSSVKAAEQDKHRLYDLGEIKGIVINKFNETHILPHDLSTILIHQDYLADPVTEKPYIYKKKTNTTFELCATFETENLKPSDTPQYMYQDDDVYNQFHRKGFDCLEYSIPSSLLEPTIPREKVFTDTSAELNEQTAIFSFRNSAPKTIYRIDVSLDPFMRNDVFTNFATGERSPLEVDDPQKFDNYTCGRILYWKIVNTTTNDESSVYSQHILCPDSDL